MINILLILLLLFNQKKDTIMSEKIDMLEFNTIVDPAEYKDPETKKSMLQFKPRYTQLIFWKWDKQYCRYNVSHWIILSGTYGQNYDYNIRKIDDMHIVTLIKSGEYTKKSTMSFKTKNITHSTTTSEYDPEILNKKLFEQHHREPPILIIKDEE